MSFFDLIIKRHSARVFEKTAIPKEHIKAMLDSIASSPSGGNYQPFKFIVVDDDETIKKICELPIGIRGFEDLSKASLFIIAVADPEKSKRYYQVDTAISLTYIDLVAHELGYGTCWVGVLENFLEDKPMKRLLNIPNDKVLLCFLAIGKETKKLLRVKKAPVESIASHNRYDIAYSQGKLVETQIEDTSIIVKVKDLDETLARLEALKRQDISIALKLDENDLNPDAGYLIMNFLDRVLRIHDNVILRTPIPRCMLREENYLAYSGHLMPVNPSLKKDLFFEHSKRGMNISSRCNSCIYFRRDLCVGFAIDVK